MENASQALIIAGTILIAMIVLSVGVYLVVNYAKVGESYEQTQQITEITKFNTNFTKFAGRDDITAQEIITLKNFVENYNAEHGTSVQVNYLGKNNNDVKFIKESFDENGKPNYFTCKETEIIYESEGRVSSITFRESIK